MKNKEFKELPSQEYLKSILNYNKKTGIFTWKEKDSSYQNKNYFNSRFANKEAGCISGTTGYIYIRIDDVLYSAHRLAWKYVYGVTPMSQLDHIDNVRTNNRINNLRIATNGENSQNLKHAKKSNKSTGLLGVFMDYPGSIYSRIRVNNVIYHLGYFDTAQEAHEAYLKKKRELHSHNTL